MSFHTVRWRLEPAWAPWFVAFTVVLGAILYVAVKGLLSGEGTVPRIEPLAVVLVLLFALGLAWSVYATFFGPGHRWLRRA